MGSYCNSSNFTSPFPFMVLLCDHDLAHLFSVKQILVSLGYKVTKFRCAEAAAAALRRNNDMFDIVVCGDLMPDVVGFRLIQIAGLELDKPVVLITSDSSRDIALQAILNGACECLDKPVWPQSLKHIWQYVVRKRRNEFSCFDSTRRSSTELLGQEPSCSNPKAGRREEEEDEGEEQEREREREHKKQRFIWTEKPHQIFVDAVNTLTLEKAVPKKILEYMRLHGVPNITRAIVASHLQKYRLYLRKTENNEVVEASKLPSQSDISLNESKENNSSGCHYMGPSISGEMPKEVFESKENINRPRTRPRPQLEQLEQAALFFSGQFVRTPIFPGQFSNIVDDNNLVVPLANSTHIGSSQDVPNNCLYLKILEDYEGIYKSKISDNLRVSNNRSYAHSIGEDYHINARRLSTQDELEQRDRRKYIPSQSNLQDNSYVLHQNLGSHH